MSRNYLFGLIATAVIGAVATAGAAQAQTPDAKYQNFYQSDKVTVQKVTVPNLYKMNMAGNLYLPKNMDPNQKYPAIIVGHPMGAVKEQSASLYATKMAEYGFVNHVH